MYRQGSYAKGIDALKRFANQHGVGRASERLFWVSDFDGIGDARRTLEFSNITPAAYATVENKYEARRVTAAQGPIVTQCGDVALLTTGPWRIMRNDFAQVTRDIRVAGLLSLLARFQTMTNGNTYVHGAISAVTTSRN